ncbi:MAG: PAS domain S-box protein [Desulfuromonadales bacterium]
MEYEHAIHIEPDEFRTMITTSLDGFLIVAVTGHILEANESYCRLVGYSREELINMHISEVDAIESPEDVSKRIEEIVQKGALRFETHRHKNGSIIDVEVCSNYSSAHGGTFFSTFRDITGHKRTREIIDARLRLIEYSINHSIDELLHETLNEAELFLKNTYKISLVVTDIGIPVMDGYKLFGEHKNLRPKLPIIISSGFGDTDVTSRLGSDNVAGIISKPYNANQLRDVLKRAVGGTNSDRLMVAAGEFIPRK